MILEENSRSRISRVVKPVEKRGIHGLWMFILIWMQMTAPMKKEIISTMPILSIPNFPISLTYCFQYIRKRSGRLKTFAISCRYLPKVARGLKSAFIEYCFMAL